MTDNTITVATASASGMNFERVHKMIDWRREVTAAAIIGFIAVCILASVAGAAALRWVERRPPAP